MSTDPPGLVERLVRDDTDRKRFLKMAGSAGAASFGAFVLAACGSSSKSASTASTSAAATSSKAAAPAGGDVGILNYALTLEYLEAAFYGAALKRAGLSGAHERFANLVYAHEAAHVVALKKGQKIAIEGHTIEWGSPSLLYMTVKNAKTGAELAKSNATAAPKEKRPEAPSRRCSDLSSITASSSAVTRNSAPFLSLRNRFLVCPPGMVPRSACDCSTVNNGRCVTVS